MVSTLAAISCSRLGAQRHMRMRGAKDASRCAPPTIKPAACWFCHVRLFARIALVWILSEDTVAGMRSPTRAGRRWAVVGRLLSRCICMVDVNQIPSTKARADRALLCRMDASAPQCTNLFPVFPAEIRLFPVRPGTENINKINSLRAFRVFVPGVPYKSCRHPEGKHDSKLNRFLLTSPHEGNSRPEHSLVCGSESDRTPNNPQ